jgi:protein arginine kinase
MSERKWYETGGPEGDIVISSRVRLARNLRGFPFPGRMDENQHRRVVEIVSKPMTESAKGLEFSLVELGGDELSAESLVERHLISPQMAKPGKPRGVVLNRDESVSVMINEEDHLRIQALGAGFCPWECLKKAEAVDKLLEGSVDFAFDSQLGYLTHCPTNLGTGLRVSVMMHLPALTESGRIRNVIAKCGKMGIAVRGVFGEGSKAEGRIFQISNQTTLGLSEADIVRQLETAVLDIISQERGARERIKRENPLSLEDKVMRARAILRSARLMTSVEAVRLISDLRFGVASGIIDSPPTYELDALLSRIRPATLALQAGRPLTESERDKLRADLLREALA